MKSLNNKDVRKGYMKFSCVMVAVIALPLLMCYSIYSTAAHESKLIESRSVTFDNTFAMQIEIVDKVDSLYNYVSLLNTSPRINDVVVQEVISSKKMTLMDELENLDTKDILLYINLLNSVNRFLSIKDSIRIVANEEQTLRLELQRCVSADQQASRKLSLEGVQTNNTLKR